MVSEFSKLPWEFTEEDLLALVIAETPEGQHVEYKRSELIRDKQKGIEALTREVSAFSNAEGGVVIIGVEESKRSRLTFPSKVDSGVPAADYTPTWLNQIIQSNIDPAISGLRVHGVPLPISGGTRDQLAFVVYVPAGKRAVQAKDYRYYQRQEDRSVPIRDFQVRDVNNRAEGPDLQLEFTLSDDGRLSSINQTEFALDVNLIVRNKSDALADTAVFRMMIPAYLKPSSSRRWVRETQEPMIQLPLEQSNVAEYRAAVLSRPYYYQEDQPIFNGVGPIVLGTYKLTFPKLSAINPDIVPLLAIASAPRMENRIISLQLNAMHDEMARICDTEKLGRKITLEDKDPLTYFREL